MGDEARSDVALTVAALVFGPLLLGGLRGGSGPLGVLVDVAVVLALTTLVPLLLLRSRAGGRAAGPGGRVLARGLALDPSPAGIGRGVVLAVPAALAGALGMVTAGATVGAALLGRLSGAPLQALPVAASTVGATVLTVFLVRRGAEAFPRSPEWTLRRILRTVGASSATVALVAGLVRVPLGASAPRVVANALALLAIVLLADRVVDARRTAPRLAVLLPGGLALYLHVTGFGFGVGLQAGALAAGTTAVLGTLALGRDGAWPVLPLALAVHLWPTCLSPLALVGGLC